MKPHLLVLQLRFTRSELVRCLYGVSEEDGCRRVLPMNCISWVVGHLATQEDTYWNSLGQGQAVAPELLPLVGYGRPASTPPLREMWDAWRRITASADAYLDTLTSALMQTHFKWGDDTAPENIGTMLIRNIDHYWFHLGEAHAMRQMLGHKDLPQFVGDLAKYAYFPESEL